MRYAPTIAFAAALCLLTACTDASPTAPSDLRADESGHPLGSGNDTNPPAGEGPGTMGTGNVTKQASGFPMGTGNRGGLAPEETTLNSEGTTDSGHPLGSGNDTGSTSEESPHPLGSGN